MKRINMDNINKRVIINHQSPNRNLYQFDKGI